MEMMNSHLPNEILAALELCQSKLIKPHYKDNAEQVAARREEKRQVKLAKQFVREESKGGDHKFVFPTFPRPGPSSAGSGSGERTPPIPRVASAPLIAQNRHHDLHHMTSSPALRISGVPEDACGGKQPATGLVSIHEEHGEQVTIQVEAEVHPVTRRQPVTQSLDQTSTSDPGNHKPSLIELTDLQFELEDSLSETRRHSSVLRHPVQSPAMVVQTLEVSPGPARQATRGNRPPKREQTSLV